MKPATGTSPTAYSYLRFSNPEQEEGDSIRRQEQLRSDWLKRHPHVTLDNTLKPDKGVSGFKGKNRTNHKNALAQFLDLVQRGRIARGSFLLIENMDRLSREKPVVAVNLLTGLLLAGVRVVQLAPDEIELSEDSDLFALLRGQMSQNTGHDESKKKSVRLGSVWGEKKKCVQHGETQPHRRDSPVNGMALMTHRLPAWVREQGGKLVEVPEAAEAVRLIYQLAASGYGIPSILRRLTDEDNPVPPIAHRCKRKRKGECLGKCQCQGEWRRSYVAKILGDRRVRGELQLYTGADRDGAPILNYYPEVVSEADWLRARAGMMQRKRYQGRVSTRRVNIFSGILRHARDGDTYIMTQRLSRTAGVTTRRFQVLVNTSGDEGKGKGYSVPYDVLEAAVCSLLREIDPAEVLGQGDEPDGTLALAQQLGGVEARIAQLSAELVTGDVPSLVSVIRTLEGQRKALAAQLAEARQNAAHPLGECWGECRSLAEALAQSPDPEDARRRLRSALRRIVSGIWLLIVPGRGQDRLAAVQLHFTEGKHRDYFLRWWPSNGRREGGWEALSSVRAGLPAYDLRDRAQAAELERDLAELAGG